MWTVTELLNGEVTNVKELEYLVPERVRGLYKSLGWSEDDLFTEPDWGRYTFLKYYPNKGLAEVIFEWED